MPDSQPFPHLIVHCLYMLLLSLNSLFPLLSCLSSGLSLGLLLRVKQLLLLLSLRLNLSLRMHFRQRLLGTLLSSLYIDRLVLNHVLLLLSRYHLRLLWLRHVLSIRMVRMLMRMLCLSRLKLMRMRLMALSWTRCGGGSL